MAFGDNEVDAPLLDAWHAFCDQIRDAGDYIYKDQSGSSAGERTNAYRYLTQNLSQAFDIWLENRDPSRPTIHAFCGPTRGLGCDNADCIYEQSWINDHDTYKISGNLGTARMFNIAVQGPWLATLHEPFGDTPVANLLGSEIESDWDGNFAVWISPEPHEGNWIRSEPGMRKVFYRQYFDGWDEVPASYRIQRVGGSEEPPPALGPDELIDSMQRAGQFVIDVVKDWPETLWEREKTADSFNSLDRYGGPASLEKFEEVDARRGRVIATMNWVIEAGQALIMEFTSQPSWFWQITACTVFGASLEFRYRQVNLTSGMTPIDSDGVTRVILSHTDPGFANWIDVQGHSRGWLYFRNMFTRDTPDAKIRVVDATDLEGTIGAVATRITPTERALEQRRRREAYQRRYPN